MFKRVLTKQPHHVQSYGNMGLAYAGLGRRPDAIACFDRALELGSGYEPAIGNRRVISQMNEGEPFVAAIFEEVHYYADRVRDLRSEGKVD